MTGEVAIFEEDPPRRMARQLVLDIDGFEGPIDVLVTLARADSDQNITLGYGAAGGPSPLVDLRLRTSTTDSGGNPSTEAPLGTAPRRWPSLR